MSNFLFKIPLREFVVARKGKKPSMLSSKPFESSVPYLDIDALENNSVKQYTHKDNSELATDQDILVVWDGSRSGLTFKGRVGAIGSTLMCLTTIGLTQDYLYYFLKSHFEMLNSNTSGSGIPHVDAELFFDLEVPYISIDMQIALIKNLEKKLKQNDSLLITQNEIIEKSLFATNVDFKFDANNVQLSFNSFKNGLIGMAISGELSKQWRQKNKLNFNMEKRDNITNVNALKNNEQVVEWEIPDTWRFIKLRYLANSFQYGTSNKSYEQGSVPVLRMGNIQDGRIVFDKLKYTSDLEDVKKYLLDTGDVLFNRTNSPELVGKTAVYESNQEAIFAGYIIRVKLIPDINPKFIAYCLNSEYAKTYYKSVMIGSASQANINAEKIGDFYVPILTAEEQTEIVNKVEELLVIIKSTEERHKKVLEDLHNLEKAVLRQAFIEESLDFSPHDDQYVNFIEKLLEEREQLEKIHKFNRVSISKNKKIMASKTQDSKSVVEVLQDMPGNTSTVEEVWRKSKYFELWESDGYEQFYKDIELNSTVLSETRSIDGMIITLTLLSDEN